MSLINKMLQDLETRDRVAGSETPATSYEDLRPVGYIREAPRRTRALLIAILGVVILAAGAFYLFDFWMPTPVKTAAVAQPSVPAGGNTPTPTPPAPAPVAESKPPPPAVVPGPKPPVVASGGTRSEQPATTRLKLKPVVQPPIVTTKKSETAPAPPAKSPPITSSARPPVIRSAPAAKTAVGQKLSKDQAPPMSDSDTGTVEKHDRLLSPQEQAEAYYREAGQLVAKGRAEDARATLAAALKIYPAYHEARELAAAVALQNGRAREAQALLTEGLKLAPNHLPFALLLARLLVDQNDNAQAIGTLEGAHSAGADNPGYLSLLAALYQRAGRHAEAVQSYRATLALRPEDARAWLGLGISLEATQDAPAAAAAYQRALQTGGIDPKLAEYAQQRLAAVKK